MRIVVAPDSFKGSLPSLRAAEAMRRGILRARPDVDVQMVPLADGGDGTAEVLRAAVGGSWVETTVTGPRPPARVQAGYVRLAPPGRRVVVEMARASGLALLPPSDLDPRVTTTRGTGELLRAVFAGEPDSVWLAVGGSATADGGTGAARVLGWRFLDAAGASLPEGGGALVRLARIVPPEPRPAMPAITVLADVTNPLVGPRGSARVFAPQKGADERAVAILEEGLETLAERIRDDFGVAVADLRGGGAAGGLAAGAVAFLSAEILPGAAVVMRAAGLERQLDGADWVVTGEGRLDEQSLDGKVASGVARIARGRGVKVAVIAGSDVLEPQRCVDAGFDVVIEAAPPSLELAAAMERAEELVEAAAARLAGEHLAFAGPASGR